MSAELLPLLKVHEYFRGVSDESRVSPTTPPGRGFLHLEGRTSSRAPVP